MIKSMLFLILFGYFMAECPDGFYEDSCGNCWLPYCYNYVSHSSQYDISEEECAGNTLMWVVPGQNNSDPYFDNFCDNECPDSFLIDDCGHCWQSFCYTFFNPGLNGDPSHSVYYDFTPEECESYGYNYYLPDHPSSPYFNSNCSDDTGDDGGDVVDACDECLDGCVSYVVQNYGYSFEDAAAWCNSTPDASYGCADTCNDYYNCGSGDANGDGSLNVSDIVFIVSYIINETIFDNNQICASDLNSDSIINVVDVVGIVDIIINQ